MAINRRSLIAGGASACVMVGSDLSIAKTTSDHTQYFLSCLRSDNRDFEVAAFTQKGRLLFLKRLPGRGHAAAVSPCKRFAVVAARRPGTFLTIVSLPDGQTLTELGSLSGHHFYGHACFSADGNILYTTENDYRTGNGRVAVRKIEDGFHATDFYPSGGIGPHEICLSSDGSRLVIANGGILTHPDSGRAKLNVPTMRPNVTIIDRESGTAIRQIKLQQSFGKLSIRHLDVSTTGPIAIAMQYEGAHHTRPPLVGLGDGLGPFRLLEWPTDLARRARNYSGSVSFDPAGAVAGVSFPRGNLVGFWETVTGRFIRSVRVQDGSGIAPGLGAGDFVLTSGFGHVFGINAMVDTEPTKLARPLDGSVSWDNHLTRVNARA